MKKMGNLFWSQTPGKFIREITNKSNNTNLINDNKKYCNLRRKILKHLFQGNYR